MPDFALSVSPSSVTINQGTTSAGIQVSVQPINGFSGSVQLALSDLPSGVTANPKSPFTVASGSNATLLLGASTVAATGNVSITVQGTSGTLAHSASLALAVQTSVVAAVSRTTYVRTDSIAALDQPAGEPPHRHMVYDSVNRHLFVANAAANRVEVLSSQDGSRVATLDVPGASSVDLSADGKTVWVGTLTQRVVGVDTGSLQRTQASQLAGIVPAPNSVFDRPEEVLTLFGGKAMVRLRQAGAGTALLALWDSTSNSLSDLTATVPQIFQSGVGAMARSADHSRVFVAADDASGEAAIFDGDGSVVTGARVLGSGTTLFAAANPDGTRFAIVFQTGSGEQIFLLDAVLNLVTTHTASNVGGLIFSRDGSQLFVAEIQNGNAVLTALAATDLHLVGQVADLSVQGVSLAIEESDETAFVFGLSNRGVAFLDASQLGSIVSLPPVLANAPSLSPATGPNTGGTTVTLTGQNFGANPALRFGTQNPTAALSANSTQIQASAPASVVSGAENVTAYFSNGSLVLAPDAFSYGPQILEVLPNAGSSAGGNQISIYGYGFGEDPGKLGIKFGATSATVQAIEDVASLGAVLGLDPTYPFPAQRVTLVAPPGPSGWVDLAVSAPSGSAVAPRAFQYLQAQQVFSKVGFYKFLTYDQKRDWVYLSNIDRVDVFDLKAGSFRAGILPPGGAPPNSLIRQAALTPDASHLAVADFGAQSVYLMNPDTANGTKIFVGGVQGDANSGPVRVAATSAQTLFIGLAGFSGGSSTCSVCLQQMDLANSPVTVELAPQPEVSLLTSAPLLDASSDGNAAFFAFAAAPGQPVAGWSATLPQQFATALTDRPATDLVTAADGTFVASRIGRAVEIRDQNLALCAVIKYSELEGIPQRTEVPGIALHPSGALVYLPFLTGPAPANAPFTDLLGGVDILDANSGRLRLRVILPEPLAMLVADSDGLHGKFLSVDENGQRLFALTASGLTVVELAQVPLGFGSLAPTTGSGGSTITVRGSGFQSGVAVTIDGKPAVTSFLDMNTLKFTLPASLNSGAQRITISNPAGETISIDAAFNAN